LLAAPSYLDHYAAEAARLRQSFFSTQPRLVGHHFISSHDSAWTVFGVLAAEWSAAQ
jgi:hypothetical protein